MKYFKRYYFFVGLLLMGVGLKAQDKIYSKENKIEAYEVTEITPAYIKGISSKNPGDSYSINPSDVLFIFNGKGNFLVVPRLFEDAAKAELYIRNFLSKENNSPESTDKIITLKNEIFTCSLTAENEKNLEFIIKGQKSSIAKSEVALIVYKNGNHKLLANINRSFRVLGAVQDKYNETVFSPVKTDSHDAPNYVKNVAFVSPSANGPKEQAQKPAVEDNGNNKVSAVSQDKKEIVNGTLKLDSATLISLQSKAITNIKELETYLKIISDKDLDAGQVNNAIAQALSLFVNEDAMVEVSSKNRSKIQLFNVKSYLNRLGFMKYSKVMIEWYNVQYVSKIRLNPDGTYAGIIEVEQKFTGMSGDRKIYEDITRKTVEIILKSYNIKRGGESKREWDVFLGNIGISVTDPQ